METLKANSVMEMGKGVMVLATTKKTDISVGGNRCLLSIDRNASHGTTKNGTKTYAGVINRAVVEIDGFVYDINMYILRREIEETPKPKAKPTSKKTSM